MSEKISIRNSSFEGHSAEGRVAGVATGTIRLRAVDSILPNTSSKGEIDGNNVAYL